MYNSNRYYGTISTAPHETTHFMIRSLTHFTDHLFQNKKALSPLLGANSAVFYAWAFHIKL